MLTIKDKINKISVPYRGATFLNFDLNYFQFCCQYFRPLSGSYISQLVINPLIDSLSESFPSPIGELHFSMLGNFSHTSLARLISVPYRGATFLNHLRDNFRSYVQFSFPSPIGELHFSIPSPQPHVLSGTNRGIAGEK